MNPNDLTIAELLALRGKIVVKNVSGGSLPLTGHQGYTFTTGQELDLVDPATPPEICSDYHTVKNMIGQASINKAPLYAAYELAQRIAAGDLQIIEDTPPDFSLQD